MAITKAEWKQIYNAPYNPAVAARISTPSSTASNLSGETHAAFQRAIEQYQPGGGYGTGVEAALERGRTKSLASGAQALVGAGLAGTTMMAGLGKKYEEEVAMPTRARVEEERATRLSDLELALAMAEQGAYGSAADRALQAGSMADQLQLAYAELSQRERQFGLSLKEQQNKTQMEYQLALLGLQKNVSGGGDSYNRPSYNSFAGGGGAASNFTAGGGTYYAPETPIYRTGGAYTWEPGETAEERLAAAGIPVGNIVRSAGGQFGGDKQAGGVQAELDAQLPADYDYWENIKFGNLGKYGIFI